MEIVPMENPAASRTGYFLLQLLMWLYNIATSMT